MTFPKGYRISKDESTSNYGRPVSLICNNCHQINPIDAKFCNRCGLMILSTCPICKNSNNLPDSSYCNQCGSPINETHRDKIMEVNTYESSESHDNIKQNFVSFVSPEHNIRIKYPNSWRRIDKLDLTNSMQKTPRGDEEITPIVLFEPTELPSNSTQISIGKQIKPVRLSIENCATMTENLLKFRNPNVVFIESVKTSIGGIPAHRSVYEVGDGIFSITYTVIDNIALFFTFGFESNKYFHEYVPIIEKIITSFEFINPTSMGYITPQPLRVMLPNQDFYEYVSSEHNLDLFILYHG